MKKNQPLVSVIVNCFNGEKYLTKCLDSIKNQTYKNWEIIFWDNRSTDNSAIIFKSYKDKRFKYFLSKKKNVLYKGRNLAINKAKGKYIAFLDTDDFWDKNKLQEQIPKFKNKKIGLVYSNFFKFTKNQIRKIAYGFNLPSGNVTKKIIENYSVGFLTVVVKANLIKKKKKIFDYKYDLLADLDFILRLSLRTNFYGINKPLAYYRIHENQLQKKKCLPRLSNFVNGLKKKK
jgi:glycosyltransferase involved in cell wall biosynthesis